jgi:hypothetical protein
MATPPERAAFRLPQPSLSHIRIPASPSEVGYAAPGGAGASLRSIPRRQHSQVLRQQLSQVESEIVEIGESRVREGLPREVDIILEISSAPGFPLSADHIHALTTGRDNQISLLNARRYTTPEGDEVTKVSLHVPYGALTHLTEKVREYGEDLTQLGNTPKPWVAQIEHIARAALEALWTDDEELPSRAVAHWWEFWVRRDPVAQAQFHREIIDRNIRLKGNGLFLPEHVVYVGQTSRAVLEASVGILNSLAEVRTSRPFRIDLPDLSGPEQHELILESIERMTPPGVQAPAVCLLDTGINRGHPLLVPILGEADNHTVFGDGDASDACGGSGHGTGMGGLAAYGDLRGLMLSNEPWVQTHRLEGVKIFNPVDPTEPDNYGSITKQGISRPEISAPTRSRVYSLAITAQESDGKPSSWSAALDSAAFGAEEPGEPKRLIIVSAGNVPIFDEEITYTYPTFNHTSRIQDPAQAWNALTVGALTHREQVEETDPESRILQRMAAAGGLSPYSSTSQNWDPHWPIKPEIVMEGGNAAVHPTHGPTRRDSLELFTTSSNVLQRPISTFWATSASAALAARLAARIQSSYPDYWPETVRGLMVHSARWNDAMLDGLNPFRTYSRENRIRLNQLLRTYGFGEPDAGRAERSSEQAVTLLREDELHPYDGTAGNATLKDCHIHQLGLPKDLLRDQLEAVCTLRVTLSYFIPPNPSSNNRIGGSRYRYAGGLLRFRVRHKDEDEETFERRVSREALAEDEEEDAQAEIPSLTDPVWALGSRLRGKGGSLIQDIWKGSAADLAQMDRIAVFPAKGWWASRSFKPDSPWYRCHRRSLRYSLIVSVEIEADVPLYSAILTELGVPINLDVTA